MKYYAFIFLLSLCFSTSTLAEEALSENVAGITLYSADEASNQAQPSNQAMGGWQEKAQEVLINALSLTGIKYKYGGSSPDTGFDCSGFVRHLYESSVGLLLPRRAEEQANSTEVIDRSELKPGDLVFFNTMKRAFSHVGIYVGDGKFIHSPRTGKAVKVDDMRSAYWLKRFNGARRVPLDSETSKP